MHDQVCKSGQPTTGKLHGLPTGARLKKFKQKGKRFASCGHVSTNKRNSAPAHLLQPESSITTNRVNKIDEACLSWMTPIVRYLSSRELPDSRVEAHKIQV